MVYLHEGRLQSVTGVRARYYSYTKLVVILGFPYHQITDLLVKQVQLKPYTATHALKSSLLCRFPYFLIYGSETGTLYRAQVKKTWGFSRLLPTDHLWHHLAWPHPTCDYPTECRNNQYRVHNCLTSAQKCWSSYQDARELPTLSDILQRATGWHTCSHKKHYKDQLKAPLNQCNVPADELERLAAHHPNWCSIVRQAVVTWMLGLSSNRFKNFIL